MTRARVWGSSIERIRAVHTDRAAIVYVRRSSRQQVLEHTESMRLQYGLVERAVALGWPRSRVTVIDDDLGVSAAVADARVGFQKLVTEDAACRAGRRVRLGADLADDRFVICFNPDAQARDAAIRARMLALLEETFADSDKLSKDKRAELRGVISTKPGLNRYLRTTPGGLLRVDKKAVEAEANLDGKFLLRCSHPKLTAEDIALGYKQLLEVERCWRDMNQIIDLRPVYPPPSQRIRAHVLLCWLALLLIRIAETGTGQTWTMLREELQRLHLGTFTGPADAFRQRTELTPAVKKTLTASACPNPPRLRGHAHNPLTISDTAA